MNVGRGRDVGAAIDRESLNVSPDDGFTNLLRENLPDAVHKLNTALTSCTVDPEASVVHERCLTTYLCSILGIALEDDGKDISPILLQRDLSDALIKVVLTERFYPMRARGQEQLPHRTPYVSAQ